MDVTLEPQVVKGFRFAGVAAGLRKEPGRKDLGVIVAERPATAVGVFTTNRVKAAPVRVSIAHLRGGGDIRTIIANSGNANACTGLAGIETAKGQAQALATAQAAATALGSEAQRNGRRKRSK